MKTFIRIFFISLILGFGTLMYLWADLNPKEIKHKSHEKPARFVNAIPITYNTQNTSIYGTGRLNSFHQISLSAQVSGEVLSGKKNIKAGEAFKKGDLLFRIFDDEAILKNQAEKSRFLSTMARVMPNIRIDYASDYPQWKSFLEDITLDKELPQLPDFKNSKLRIYLSAQNILSAYYNIKANEVRLKYYNIYAPFTGTFAEVFVQEGSFINPGTKVASIIQTDNFELCIPLKTTEVHRVQIGDPVEITDDLVAHLWQGKISRIAQFVDPKTQSVNVYIGLNQTAGHPLYQGMYLNAEIPNIQIENTMGIPRNAVFNQNEVFTIENGKLKKKSIQIIKIDDKMVFFNGLDEQEMIVVEPLINAVESAEVEVLGKEQI